MRWKMRSIRELATAICGDEDYFLYRSSSRITEFFHDCGLDYRHDGTTRGWWVANKLQEVLALPQPNPFALPEAFIRIIRAVLDKEDEQDGDIGRNKALATVNVTLHREGWEAFYDECDVPQLRHLRTDTLAQAVNPHRPLSYEEEQRKRQLAFYLDVCSEDELIETVLLPLFRQLGFQRITAAGHKDKALEYGKDIWMKYVLPTLNVLYFGIQVKKGKIDSAGISKAGSANIAEVYNQTIMMLGHAIFDPELSRRSLVDHAFIISGGEITKQARNWLGEKLDVTRRSQIMFMDRNDILNLFIVTNLSVPEYKNAGKGDDLPF